MSLRPKYIDDMIFHPIAFAKISWMFLGVMRSFFLCVRKLFGFLNNSLMYLEGNDKSLFNIHDMGMVAKFLVNS